MHILVDIGNTNIGFAVFDGTNIIKKWRISSHLQRTNDEYILWLKSIVADKFNFYDIIIGSVVPDITEELKSAIKIFFNIKRYSLIDFTSFI